MCLSAEVSFIAAAGLIPAGALSMRQAWRGDRRYLPLATLPLLFGLQQLAEGILQVPAPPHAIHAARPAR